jgi:hypothetical protein
MNIFDEFGKKKSSDDASEAQRMLAMQARSSGTDDILRQSLPVFEEYERELNARGVSAKLQRIGLSGLRLKIQMKWTFGVVAFDQGDFVAYIESDPAHSNGYARDDYTAAAGPPSTAPWAGLVELRAFLDRAIAIFRDRYGNNTRSPGFSP